MLAEVQIATGLNSVLLSLFTDFENFSVFKPAAQQEKSVNGVFDQGHRLRRCLENAAEEMSA